MTRGSFTLLGGRSMFTFLLTYFDFPQMAIQRPEKSRLESAQAEFKRFEARCGAMLDGGGWLGMVRRKLKFSSGAAAGVDHYDGQIALADVTLCIVGLMVVKVMNGYNVGHIATAKTVYSLRRAWKMYQQCYASVLDVYRAVYDLNPGQQVNHDFYSIYLYHGYLYTQQLITVRPITNNTRLGKLHSRVFLFTLLCASDENAPRWPPVLKRRQSSSAASLASTSNVGNRMYRSATTSFETFRRDRYTRTIQYILILLNNGYCKPKLSKTVQVVITGVFRNVLWVGVGAQSKVNILSKKILKSINYDE